MNIPLMLAAHTASWSWALIALGVALVSILAPLLSWGAIALIRRTGWRWRGLRTRELMVGVAIAAVLMAAGRLEVRVSGEYPGVTAGLGGFTCGIYRKRPSWPFGTFALGDPRARSCWYQPWGGLCLWVGVGQRTHNEDTTP